MRFLFITVLVTLFVIAFLPAFIRMGKALANYVKKNSK